MKEKIKNGIKKIINNKKVLYAMVTGAVSVFVLSLVLVLAIKTTAGKEDMENNTTTTEKYTDGPEESQDSDMDMVSKGEEATTYPEEVQTKEDGSVVSVVTQDGQIVDISSAQTEVDEEGNTIFTTQSGDKVILDSKGNVSYEKQTQDIETTETATTTVQQQEADSVQPVQPPTTAVQQPTTQAPTVSSVPADYSPTAKYSWEEIKHLTIQEAGPAQGFHYPTVDYSKLPVQSFDHYFVNPEDYGEDCIRIYQDEWGSYKFDTWSENNQLTFPEEIPLYKYVNWNGKIGYFSDGTVDEFQTGIYSTDFWNANLTGEIGHIKFGSNRTWINEELYWFTYITLDD